MISLLIYLLLFFQDILLRFINLYNYYLFCIGCFLFSMYSSIMKFSVTLELIMVIFVFPLILILIYNYVVFVDTIVLSAETISQYFFWLLLSEKLSSFLIFLRDVFFGCTKDHSDKISYIFYDHSGFHIYLLYMTVKVSVCN